MFSLDPAAGPALEKLAADARKRFDALPAAEKKRVDEFTPSAHAKAIDRWIERQSGWIAEVLLLHLGSVDYKARDAWRAALDTKFAASLPVDSKKQLLGTLEMRPDATLVFRFSKLALEIPKAAPQYAEALALAPGLAAGKPRVLYRGQDGVVSDKP